MTSTKTFAAEGTISIPLQEGKKAYFASDFHLGMPNKEISLQRERKIIRWLEYIRPTAEVIFLVGDIFDFWFEYKQSIPKGYIRLQGKLADLTDAGIPIIFFSGNHDMWMFDYFTKELAIPIFRKPKQFILGQRKFLIGHGDGLGPGDHIYKILKQIFASKLCQWLFARIHPNTGIAIANAWSRRSRMASDAKGEEKFMGDDEWLYTYAREIEAQEHHDYYIFGHRHLPLNLPVGNNSYYINLGEWINHCTYGSFDGNRMELTTFH
ncbi:UDP-2,3-diacylglucosamine diphosphatase [Rhodocytophaga aerolata]|uniref:UDP-2,3-diacylglucosamine diphosphatase n=1 Tax=Rhodocytophaga aerolata TaxID=455078 RepID=A0ABT8R210_9BACT|nr:UDP-2,3-diacylglucosamine diphosphatase [Rhodocytophaga aerolata]MDO1446135.1 UDP-2,3-diacylglucosamine diphosphatase [Rhodocytophaga aerolata]